LEIKDLKALAVWTDCVDYLELLASLDPRDRLEILDHLAILVHKASRVQQVQLAVLEIVARKDRKAREDRLDKTVPWGREATRDLRELPAHRETLVALVSQDCVATSDFVVQLVLLDQQDQQGSPVSRASRVPLAIPAPSVYRVLMEVRVQMETLAQRASLV